MTATTVLGQRTKNTLDGRDADVARLPDPASATCIAELDGAAYVARGSVHNAGNVARTKKMIRRAFETQEAGPGFSFVEVLTMCPTGWFIATADAPDYLTTTLAPGARARRAEGRGHRAERVVDTVVVAYPWNADDDAARAAAGRASPTSRSSPRRTSARSGTTFPARPTSSTDAERAVWARAEATLALDLPEGHRRARARTCGGCRRSAPGSTTSHDAGLPGDVRRHQRRRCRRRAHRRVRDRAACSRCGSASTEIDEQQRTHDWKPEFGTPGRGADPRGDRPRARSAPRSRSAPARSACTIIGTRRSYRPGARTRRGRRAPRHRRPPRRAGAAATRWS